MFFFISALRVTGKIKIKKHMAKIEIKSVNIKFSCR